MSSDISAENQTKGQAAQPVQPDLAAQAHAFWAKNRPILYGACVLVLLAIIGHEGWGYFSAARENSVQEDYTATGGAPDRLARFAADHAGHSLAGVALLQIADSKYAAGDFTAARDGYQKAVAGLSDDTLKARARLGAAVSQIATGDQAGGEAALKALGSDTTANKNIRAEASYHLAMLARDAGRTEEARKLVEEIAKLDGAGHWAQQAMMLSASLPAPANQGLSLGK
jgi:hypothetical protein